MTYFFRHSIQLLFFCLSTVLISPAHAGLLDDAKGMLNTIQKSTPDGAAQNPTGTLSNSEIINSFKEALRANPTARTTGTLKRVFGS